MTQTIAEGQPLTIAGQSWTVVHRSQHVIGLVNARGTARMMKAQGVTTLWSLSGADHRVRGNAVRVQIDGDTLREI